MCPARQPLDIQSNTLRYAERYSNGRLLLTLLHKTLQPRPSCLSDSFLVTTLTALENERFGIQITNLFARNDPWTAFASPEGIRVKDGEKITQNVLKKRKNNCKGRCLLDMKSLAAAYRYNRTDLGFCSATKSILSCLPDA